MNDDKLTLYYYKDGLTQAERLEVTNALAADTELAARYKLLSNSLSQLSDAEPDAVIEQKQLGKLCKKLGVGLAHRKEPS